MYNPPRITRGLYEGIPLFTKQAAKRQQLLCLDGASPRCGHRTTKDKCFVYDGESSQTLLFQKLYLEILGEKLCDVELFSDEKSEISIRVRLF